MSAVIRIENLSKSFGKQVALSHISASVDSGDVIGIVGKNGAGKTTLLELLLGFGVPTAGSSSVFGEDSLRLSDSVKSRIGFVPQQDELIQVLTGAQQLLIAASLNRHWNHELVEKLVTDWEIPLDRRILKLSVGERQKLSVLMALGHEPELLVLDEPVASLDPIARRAFIQTVIGLTEEAKRTVLFSTHIVSDLERVANRVWVVRNGELFWQDGLDELKESVARIHVSGSVNPNDFQSAARAKLIRSEGAASTYLTTHLNGFDPGSMAARFDAEIEVERISLEEIFVELHR